MDKLKRPRSVSSSGCKYFGVVFKAIVSLSNSSSTLITSGRVDFANSIDSSSSVTTLQNPPQQPSMDVHEKFINPLACKNALISCNNWNSIFCCWFDIRHLHILALLQTTSKIVPITRKINNNYYYND